MLNFDNTNTRHDFKRAFFLRFVFVILFSLAIFAASNAPVFSQSNVTGGFEGRVTDGEGGPGLANIAVQFENLANGFRTARRTDASGFFQQDFLAPGIYSISVTIEGYEPFKQNQELYATRSNRFVPLPIALKKFTSGGVVTPTPTPSPNTTTTVVAQSDVSQGTDLNPRRDGAFNNILVSTLPLGGTTLTRTFDELALLIPGVYLSPQAIGNTVGPGIGGGVGTSGQFSVNGLRSRANNFTVDGSDNNDEDIGVRRQGFFSLVPQPIESIQEFQIITLLAPAQYGRNLGAQVNAISKQGGNDFRGSIYGLFSFDRFNAPNFFDTTSGDSISNLQGRTTGGTLLPVFVNGAQRRETFNAGEKDVFTLLQGGFAVGGRIVKNKAFFFVSGEGQSLDATQEKNFAVPTVEQRGLFGAGATGLCIGTTVPCPANQAVFPTSVGGDAVFSLFPFPNNPNGVFGRNTYTQSLPADAKGLILSGRFDWNAFKINGNQQTFTARYNYTDDERDLTDVGGAIFSQIRPLVRTDNFSTYLAGSLTNNVSNELRFSWGRTKLDFEEIKDGTGFLSPVAGFNSGVDTRFLLNARLLGNFTLPGTPIAGCVGGTVCFQNYGSTTQNSSLGPIGQVIIAGFSPVGVDVFNFPQQRENNTYQIADTMRWQIGRNAFAFGTDIRRTVLDSDLPRNSRPLVTFNGGFICTQVTNDVCTSVGLSNPLDLASSGAATGFFQSLVLPGFDSKISLSYYQLNFFVQDELRLSKNFVVNLGLRYEYNTPPKEADRKIEDTFNTPQTRFPGPITVQNPAGVIELYKGFQDFIAGRKNIYETNRNNFAPRIGFAWSPNRNTVVRGGYGIYYDQILGAVVSQSRNVFPTFSTVNTGGGDLGCNSLDGSTIFTFLNPINGSYALNGDCTGLIRIVQPGTLNTLNVTQNVSQLALITRLLLDFPRTNGTSFGATIPQRSLQMPMAHQYSIGFEQRLFGNTFLSAAYVGTLGRKLLRFTTPNLGSNFLARLDGYFADDDGSPLVIGTTSDPLRPNDDVGPINQFETTGRSRYDSLQIGLRGRLSNKFNYQIGYVFGNVKDDVSDVFDLAGAFSLPQNSRTFEGEYAPANFDVRHRFTYNFVYDLPLLKSQNDAVEFFFGGWQISGTGKFNTGQPFTVNSIYDVNRDGNLTDRLNNTQFINVTGNNRNPLQLTCTTTTQCQSMLAPIGRDGAVGRNSFRGPNLLELDLSFAKRWIFRETHSFQLRVDVFNFINRANFALPVRFLEAPGFGQATDTVTPGRRIQFNLKYSF